MEETNTSYIGIKYTIHSVYIYILYNEYICIYIIIVVCCFSSLKCQVIFARFLYWTTFGMGSCDMMIKFTANHRLIQDDERTRSSQGAKLKLVHKSPETHLANQKKTNWIVVSNLLNILKYQSWMKPMNFMHVRWGNNFAKSPIPRLCNARCHGVHNVKKAGKPWQVDTSQYVIYSADIYSMYIYHIHIIYHIDISYII